MRLSKTNIFFVYLLLAAIFLDGFTIRSVGGFDFYYYYIIFIISIITNSIQQRKLSIGPAWFVKFIFFFFLVNIVTGVLYQTFGFLMIKQIGGILFSAMAYWALFMFANGNLRLIGKAYINVAFIESLYGLTGLLVSSTGLGRFGVYGQSGNLLGLAKISGSTEEPYFLAVSLIPAVYIHINDILSKKSLVDHDFSWVKCVTTISCFLLTGASSGYVAVFLMLAFVAYNKQLLNLRSLGLVLLPAFLFAVYFLFNIFSSNSKDFTSRVNDTWYVFFSDEDEGVKAGKINGSSFALYSNFKVASNSFAENPISGSGLGTHELNYEKYFYEHFSSRIVKRFVAELNKQDANSTFIRLISETGVLGLAFFLYFVFRNLLIKRNADPTIRFLILFNQGIFIMMLIRLLRTGNYVGNGFFFFFFMYWALYEFLRSTAEAPTNKILANKLNLDRQPVPVV